MGTLTLFSVQSSSVYSLLSSASKANDDRACVAFLPAVCECALVHPSVDHYNLCVAVTWLQLPAVEEGSPVFQSCSGPFQQESGSPI